MTIFALGPPNLKKGQNVNFLRCCWKYVSWGSFLCWLTWWCVKNTQVKNLMIFGPKIEISYNSMQIFDQLQALRWSRPGTLKSLENSSFFSSKNILSKKYGMWGGGCLPSGSKIEFFWKKSSGWFWTFRVCVAITIHGASGWGFWGVSLFA